MPPPVTPGERAYTAYWRVLAPMKLPWARLSLAERRAWHAAARAAIRAWESAAPRVVERWTDAQE